MTGGPNGSTSTSFGVASLSFYSLFVIAVAWISALWLWCGPHRCHCRFFVLFCRSFVWQVAYSCVCPVVHFFQQEPPNKSPPFLRLHPCCIPRIVRVVMSLWLLLLLLWTCLPFGTWSFVLKSPVLSSFRPGKDDSLLSSPQIGPFLTRDDDDDDDDSMGRCIIGPNQRQGRRRRFGGPGTAPHQTKEHGTFPLVVLDHR